RRHTRFSRDWSSDVCSSDLGLPVSMLPRNYNNGIRIDQAPGYVVISIEMAHESRIVPIDGRAPLDPAIKQWLGESRGRWEGNTRSEERRVGKDGNAWSSTEQ